MYRKNAGFTTVVDLEDFKKMTWSFLTNIKMVWQYDGLAYQFRKAGIPLYGIDRGTMKMNHPIMTMAVPASRDKNYGVDIYVPVEMKKKAAKLIADEEVLRNCAELEQREGKQHHEAFEKAAREAKKRNARAGKRTGKEVVRSLISSLS